VWSYKQLLKAITALLTSDGTRENPHFHSLIIQSTFCVPCSKGKSDRSSSFFKRVLIAVFWNILWWQEKESLNALAAQRMGKFFFFDNSYSIWRGVFSPVVLLVLRYIPIPYIFNALCWCFSKKYDEICWDFTRCRIVVYYRNFGRTNQSNFKGQAVKKNLALLDPWHGNNILSRNVRNRLYHSTPRKIPKDFWSHLHLSGNLESRKKYDLTLTKTKEKLTPRTVYVAAMNLLVEDRWYVMEHAQKPDFVFRRNGRVHLTL